jgi:hypothetical protein
MAITLLSFKSIDDLIDGMKDIPDYVTDIGLVFNVREGEEEDQTVPPEEMPPESSPRSRGTENEASKEDMAEDATEYRPPEEEMS